MSGKVYFITGGNRGIGFSLAKYLAKESSNKIIVSVRKESDQLIELQKASGNIEIVKLDVSLQESIDKLDSQLSKVAPNGIDVFISNAGIADGPAATVLSTTRESYLGHFYTNTLGPIFVTQVVYKYLQKKPTKTIVYVSSIAGQIGGGVSFPVATYGTSKAALNYAAKELSSELKEEGFTIVPIHPGLVLTDMGAAAAEKFREISPDIEKFLPTALTPDQSAEDIYKNIIAKVTTKDNGKFLDHTGEELPW